MVIYDLSKSTYTSKFGNYVFYFSSLFYKTKFDDTIEHYVEYEKLKLRGKYNVSFDKIGIEDILAIALYKKIEKRGFRITGTDGNDYSYYFIGC